MNPRPPKPVKLISGMLSAFPELFGEAEEELQKAFGEIDLMSEATAFDFTDYYEEEMGANIQRKFLSFADLIDPAQLSDIKLFTNDLEERFAKKEKERGVARPINLDPGYVSSSKLILATTKDYSHRIYLKDCVYAEVTLHFQKGRFVDWPWTYPDYKTEKYLEFFSSVRELYMRQLRIMGLGGG